MDVPMANHTELKLKTKHEPPMNHPCENHENYQPTKKPVKHEPNLETTTQPETDQKRINQPKKPRTNQRQAPTIDEA